jgi:hypothetical protein
MNVSFSVALQHSDIIRVSKHFLSDKELITLRMMHYALCHGFRPEAMFNLGVRSVLHLVARGRVNPMTALPRPSESAWSYSRRMPFPISYKQLLATSNEILKTKFNLSALRGMTSEGAGFSYTPLLPRLQLALSAKDFSRTIDFFPFRRQV